MKSFGVILVLAGCASCGDDGPVNPDAEPDAEVPDAGPCGADLAYSGGYEDWDSTDNVFLGVFGATVTEVGNATNTASTAPNGRSSLCLPSTAGSQVTYVQTANDYLPARATIDPAAVRGSYDLRGLKTTRVDSLHTELGGATYDATRALVEIEVHGTPSGDPVDGVSISIGGASGGFHDDASHAWQVGATTSGGRYVVYPNVAITGGGEVTLGVLAAGKTCHAPATVHVVAGEVAMTTVVCED